MTHTNSPELIEDEIDRTRARIEARVDRLSDDLNPIGLFSRLTGADSRSLPDTMSKLVELARANPVAACLTAAGAAGLLAGGSSLAKPDDRGEPQPPRQPPRAGDPAQRVAQSAANLKAKAATAKHDVSDAATSVKNSVREGLVSTGEYVRDQADTAVESVAGAYEKASGELRSAADEISSQVRKAPARARDGSERAVNWVRENPVPAALMALAAGATVASLFAVRGATSPRIEEHKPRKTELKAPDKASSMPAPAVHTPQARSASRGV